MVTEAGAVNPVLSTDRAARPDARSRLRVGAGAAGAAVLGAAPHVLHHAGPLAGAALLAGAAGTALFVAFGLLAAVPMLLRLHRRTGSWRAPAGLLVLFAAVFVVSTVNIGPALSDDDEPAAQASEPSGHQAHHP